MENFLKRRENYRKTKDEIIRLRKEGKGYSFLQKEFRVGYKILSEKFKKLGYRLRRINYRQTRLFHAVRPPHEIPK